MCCVSAHGIEKKACRKGEWLPNVLCGIPHAMAGEDLKAINASTSLVSWFLGRASYKYVEQLLIFHPTEKVDCGDDAHEARERKNKDPAADAKA
mmetsp:Transcript_113660/g.220477  ORF Transcript_113660/g.220477 Transcript_113660/m.220477 type:complete len:94 (+) Transcript_113660:712-993(+)